MMVVAQQACAAKLPGFGSAMLRLCACWSRAKHATNRCCCAARPQVQIIRIQLRVPEYGWTTQKVGPWAAQHVGAACVCSCYSSCTLPPYK